MKFAISGLFPLHMLHTNLVKIRPVVSEEKMLTGDGRHTMTDDTRRRTPSHSSRSPEWPKIFFSRTTGPIATKLATNQPWVMIIQVYENEGLHPFPMGDNYEIVKIHWQKLQKKSPPCAKHPWVKGIQICSNKETFNSQTQKINDFSSPNQC